MLLMWSNELEQTLWCIPSGEGETGGGAAGGGESEEEEMNEEQEEEKGNEK
jgi:hypothetical protein